MTDEAATARIRAHENNIRRYCNLLATELSELEREFISRRITEEESELDLLSGSDVPAARIVAPRATVPNADIAVTT